VTSYELIFEDRTKYLYVLVSGELNRKTDFEIDAEIKKECRKRRRNRVMIDIRESRSRLSFLQNFVAATSYRKRMGTYIRAIAIVDSKKHMENSQLFELTAVSHGARLRFFTSTIAAEQWLIEDSD
jgi:hypothetical protein